MKKQTTDAEIIRAAMSLLGRSTSLAKKAAARLNGLKPCAAGKKRGRPKKSSPKK